MEYCKLVKINELILTVTMLQVPESQIKKRLSLDNSWWENEASTAQAIARDYEPRGYLEPFYRLCTTTDVRRAVVLMGQRRVGKTVMIHQAIDRLINSDVNPRSITYVALDTPLYNGLSLEQLVELAETCAQPARGDSRFYFFDEIQYLKDWDVHLKSLVDTYPDYRFVVSGSAAAALSVASKESGAGRFSDFVLPPLTFSEYLNLTKKEPGLVTLNEKIVGNEYTFSVDVHDIDKLNKEFVRYLNFGGYPESALIEAIQQDQQRFIKSDIVDKVLLRDLPSIYGISDIQELNSLFSTVAYNTGEEISLDGIGQTAGIVKNTIKRYLDYLEAAFLTRRLFRVDSASKPLKRQRTFKIFLTNASMHAALFGDIDEASERVGHLVETAILGQWLHYESGFRLYYGRWAHGEIDLICIKTNTRNPVWAVESTWSDDVSKKLSVLNKYASENPSVTDQLWIASKTIHQDVDLSSTQVHVMPASLYAYIAGRAAMGWKFQKTPELQPDLPIG